jgi:hypothetical protein
MSKVFICRAHSRREPGFCIPDEPDFNEWFLSEEFCWGAVEALKGSGHDVDVLGASLGIRIAIIKAHCRNYPSTDTAAVEIHCNAMEGRPLQRGYFCMTWYDSERAIKLAQAINREIRDLRPLAKCRGINKVSHTHRWVGTGMEYPDGPLGFLENVSCPSVIVETGYLTNPIDSNWLREQGNRYVLGHSIGQGILHYLEDRNGSAKSAE